MNHTPPGNEDLTANRQAVTAAVLTYLVARRRVPARIGGCGVGFRVLSVAILAAVPRLYEVV
jgi:hypothetical protein